EALVRNLLAGRARLARLGARAPRVLYSPDAFGHPAALPTLAEGFGLPVVITWRGLGGECWPPGDTFRWRAPHGAEVVVHHLPRSGYEIAANIPSAPDEVREWWLRTRPQLVERARLDVLLLLNGADHHARQPDLERAIELLTQAVAPDTLRRSSLDSFAAALADRAPSADLPIIAGELRASYGYTWALQGTFSTRAFQKRDNAAVERLLIREAEPWAALAWRARRRSRSHLLGAAWQTLLLCHPHDTLCGCSIDEVARAMSARLEDARAQGRGVRDDSLLELIGHDPVAAREARAGWRHVVVARNSCSRVREGVAELEIAITRERIPVGPGAARSATPAPPVPGFVFEDGSVVYQVLERSERQDRVDSPAHYPDNALVDTWRVVARVPPVRGYGLLALAVRASDSPASPVHDGTAAPTDAVEAGHHWADNGILRVDISPSGEVSLTAADGWQQRTVLDFEHVGDRGDLYTFSEVGEPVRKARFLGTTLVHAGPLRAELNARWEMDIPAFTSRSLRDSTIVAIPLHVRLILDAAAPFLRCIIAGNNTARDHRLRLIFRTGLKGAEVHADAAFGPVARERIVVSAAAAAIERPPATAPLARYVSLSTSTGGFTLFSDGLAEYEAATDGEIAVTLVRAVGELSRNDLPERPGHAGWPVPTPEAQCLGPFAGEFALMPHGPRDVQTIQHIEQIADDVLLPLTGNTLRSALAVPPPTFGIELDGQGLAFSTCKQSEDGEWLLLRCVNMAEAPVRGRWRVGSSIAEARTARLDESPGPALEVSDSAIFFEAGAREVVTILAR
ncbi:MAG TPA: glycoside hydrolase family 38 C-terminal domain-containing protein, partial [Gemmatimonadaceae bacterium]|nr:glycoside hydrolase family 38 C-terminal domain-containing protein [Gemmatimonadaceae bacterium]